MELNGYNHYLDYYRNITADDIKRVANEYIKPEQMSILVVGNPELYEKSMEEFGPITNIELPEPLTD